jgi:hypothetical protein
MKTLAPRMRASRVALNFELPYLNKHLFPFDWMFKIKDCFETCLHSRKHVIDDASNDSFHFDLSYSGVKKATVTMTITIQKQFTSPELGDEPATDSLARNWVYESVDVIITCPPPYVNTKIHFFRNRSNI